MILVNLYSNINRKHLEIISITRYRHLKIERYVNKSCIIDLFTSSNKTKKKKNKKMYKKNFI